MRCWSSIAVGLVTGLLGAACSFHAAGVISTKIVDEETRRPIPSAVAQLDRSYSCPLYHGSHFEQDPLMEAAANSDGRILIGRLPTQVGCRRSDVMSVVAPGYLPTPFFLRDVNPLRPVRFAIERDAYGPILVREAEPHPGDHPFPALRLEPLPRRPLEPYFVVEIDRVGPLYRKALAAARAVPFAPAGPPGVFVSHPGAQFDRLAVAWSGVVDGSRLTLIAQDRATGLVHNWSMRGDQIQPPLALPPDFRIVSGLGSRGFPLIARSGEMYFPNSLTASVKRLATPDWVLTKTTGMTLGAGGPAYPNVVVMDTTGREFVSYQDRGYVKDPPEVPSVRVPVREWLPGVEHVECFTHQLWEPGYGGLNLFAGHTRFFYIGTTAKGKKLFFEGTGSLPRRVEEVRVPVDVLTNEVTACATTREALYIAVRAGRIYRLEISRAPKAQTLAATVTGSVELKGPSGPIVFIALAGGPVQPDWDSPWEALYAVAGDQSIYRFSADLKPDQHVARKP